jgi:hypothetical protein
MSSIGAARATEKAAAKANRYDRVCIFGTEKDRGRYGNEGEK